MCGNGHRFEGWFENRESFERQSDEKLVLCPVCDSPVVKKLPSACSVHTGKACEPVRSGNTPGAQSFLRELANYVNNNFEDVGANFASEAVKMKHGEASTRSIRGTTTAVDEETLEDEGIEFFKVALPKYDA